MYEDIMMDIWTTCSHVLLPILSQILLLDYLLVILVFRHSSLCRAFLALSCVWYVRCRPQMFPLSDHFLIKFVGQHETLKSPSLLQQG